MDTYVKSIKEELKESCNFFSNNNKKEREEWVVKEFLKYLIERFDGNGIQESDKEPIDVIFKTDKHDIGFQIKEILDDGRKRDKEYKDKLKAIKEEKKPNNLLENYIHHYIPFNNSIPRLIS